MSVGSVGLFDIPSAIWQTLNFQQDLQALSPGAHFQAHKIALCKSKAVLALIYNKYLRRFIKVEN
jgi:hypothetical protein